jgi:hypothetical protein
MRTKRRTKTQEGTVRHDSAFSVLVPWFLAAFWSNSRIPHVGIAFGHGFYTGSIAYDIPISCFLLYIILHGPVISPIP